MPMKCFALAALCACAAVSLAPERACAAPAPFTLRSNDVVAFVGGTDVASMLDSGHLEALLAVRFPGAGFRNFGWEGDTVFAQPRDVGFPPLAEHLQRAGATVVFVQFGRAEALSGRETVPTFHAALAKLVEQCVKQTPRILLVTPAPFESGDGMAPDLSSRNTQLAAHANAIRTLARARQLPLVDLFDEFGGAAHSEPRITTDGLLLSPRGHAHVAEAFTRQLGFRDLTLRAGGVDQNGRWSNESFEKLRQHVLEKNRLWFNYWRPQNWAFLGGDRISQQSSRDHRNPSVRWFPAEMEKYVPLLRAQEAEIEAAAKMVREEK